MQRGTRIAMGAAAALAAGAAMAAVPLSGDSVDVPIGTVLHGDVYAAGRSVEVSGRIEGDLYAASPVVAVTSAGQVDGDLVAGGGTVVVGGHVGSVRAAGSVVSVTGIVDGDLLFFGATLNVAPEARIGGDLWVFGGEAVVRGQVGGALLVRGGRLNLSGRIGRGADVEVDALEVAPGARIEGDLRYRARKESALPLAQVVTGNVVYEPKPKGDDDDGGGPGVFSVVLWTIKLLGALLVGAVLLRLVPAGSRASVAAVGREPAVALGVGLAAGLVAPLAAALAAVLTVGVALPLAGIVWLLVAVGLYVAKLPVALWTGERLLRLAGRASPGRGTALALGTLVLYLAFAVPFCLGTFLWFAVAFVGLGAILLAFRRQALPAVAEAV